MATGRRFGCHFDRRPPSCHPEHRLPSCHPERRSPPCHPERSRGIWLRMGGAPRPRADVSATLRSARHDKRNELTRRDALRKATGGPHELYQQIPAAPQTGELVQVGKRRFVWLRAKQHVPSQAESPGLPGIRHGAKKRVRVTSAQSKNLPMSPGNSQVSRSDHLASQATVAVP